MTIQQLRDPPTFQSYAAHELASESDYALTLAERGLTHSMRCVCWVNGSVPNDPEGISLAIRRPIAEVEVALTERVLAHFEHDPNHATRLISTELDAQMARLLDRRERQVIGGRTGADATNRARWGTSGKPTDDPSGKPTTEPSGNSSASSRLLNKAQHSTTPAQPSSRSAVKEGSANLRKKCACAEKF